jgi:hypothetical protein
MEDVVPGCGYRVGAVVDDTREEKGKEKERSREGPEERCKTPNPVGNVCDEDCTGQKED